MTGVVSPEAKNDGFCQFRMSHARSVGIHRDVHVKLSEIFVSNSKIVCDNKALDTVT